MGSLTRMRRLLIHNMMKDSLLRAVPVFLLKALICMNVVPSPPWLNVQLYISGLTNLTMLSNAPRCLLILGVMRRCVVSVFVLVLMRLLGHWFPHRGVEIRRLTTHWTKSFYTVGVCARMHRLLADSTMKSCLLMFFSVGATPRVIFRSVVRFIVVAPIRSVAISTLPQTTGRFLVRLFYGAQTLSNCAAAVPHSQSWRLL